MQSGISASSELHTAFQTLVSTPTHRALPVVIESERLVPLPPITTSTPDFHNDLLSLSPHLLPDRALYLLLRRYPNSPSGFVAVTYVPDAAPVRQKMLFASTRLTLVRELGPERFREQVFATDKDDLTRDGWEKHEAHGALGAPLTEEEEVLGEVRRKEAEEGRGTGERKSHLSGHTGLVVEADAVKALVELKAGGNNLVMLRLNNKEAIELAGTSGADAGSLATAISDTEPRYSFFRHTHNAGGADKKAMIFIYTCPSSSKVKERMIYATLKRGVIDAASNEAGIEVDKNLEATNPSEITADMINEEFQPKQEQKPGFSRPKRPGKR